MLDPKKLLERLPRIEVNDRPFRYLGRRLVQTLAKSATANLLLGSRSATGRYLVVRLVASEDEKEQWEQQFRESRTAILAEMEREAAAHEIQPRSKLEVDLFVVTDADAQRGEAEWVIATVFSDDAEISTAYSRLQEERELILPLRVRTLHLESEPGEAQVYLNHKPIGVTPCRVEDIPEGEHAITLVRPGYLPYEDTLRVTPGRAGQKLTYRAQLTPEPPMGQLEIRTFPPRARITINGETRESPAEWRLPTGPAELYIELDEFEPQLLQIDVPPTPEHRPYRVQARLAYNGPDCDEVVGRLIIYKPGTVLPEPAHPAPKAPAQASTISSFFRDPEPEKTAWPEWDLPEFVLPPPPKPAEPEVLGERALRRGVILLGREDPQGTLVPDVRLFDPENTVTRGCHAWLYVYADRSTGAVYNTFLIGNNSPAGIRVDGQLVMESRRLSDNSIVEIGNFKMKVVKEVPEARVEFGF